MLKVFIHNADSLDIFTQAGNTGDQRTDSPHDQFYFNTGIIGLVKLVDDLIINQAVKFQILCRHPFLPWHF